VGSVREGIARLLGLFQKRGCEQSLDAEMRAHLEALTEENIRRGMNAEQARHAAHRESGGVRQAKERYRDQRGLPVVETLLADLRFAVRQLGRRPGITALMIVTLALGIGANTAIFSVVHAVLLAPLPYPHSDRLAIVWSVFGKEGRAPASGTEFAKLASDSRLFEEFAGLVLSLLLTPWITSLLFGVHPADFGTFLASSIFLAGVGLLACYFPARRAIRVDPLVALRYE
jgi:hypothetical protein